MRTLRYLGICQMTRKTGLEADKILEKIKGMDELIVGYDKSYLNRKGFLLEKLKIQTKSKLLEHIRALGRDVFISAKTRTIEDEKERLNKRKELLLRTRRVKVIFNIDLETACKIVSKFHMFRTYNELGGCMDCCNVMKYGEYLIEYKVSPEDEYIVVTKYK